MIEWRMRVYFVENPTEGGVGGSRLFGINYIDEEIKSKAREALEGIKRGEQG